MNTMESASVALLLAQDGDDLRIGIIVRNVVGPLIRDPVERRLSGEPVAIALAVEVSGSLRQLAQRVAENGNLVAWLRAGEPERGAGQSAARRSARTIPADPGSKVERRMESGLSTAKTDKSANSRGPPPRAIPEAIVNVRLAADR